MALNGTTAITSSECQWRNSSGHRDKESDVKTNKKKEKKKILLTAVDLNPPEQPQFQRVPLSLFVSAVQCDECA